MKWLKEILSAKGELSSKRICGVIGFLVCAGILLYCTVLTIQAPEMIDTFIVSCMSLLGLDSVTNIWKKNE